VKGRQKLYTLREARKREKALHKRRTSEKADAQNLAVPGSLHFERIRRPKKKRGGILFLNSRGYKGRPEKKGKTWKRVGSRSGTLGASREYWLDYSSVRREQIARKRLGKGLKHIASDEQLFSGPDIEKKRA